MSVLLIQEYIMRMHVCVTDLFSADCCHCCHTGFAQYGFILDIWYIDRCVQCESQCLLLKQEYIIRVCVFVLQTQSAQTAITAVIRRVCTAWLYPGCMLCSTSCPVSSSPCLRDFLSDFPVSSCFKDFTLSVYEQNWSSWCDQSPPLSLIHISEPTRPP